jgi:hypothetical protein
MPDPKPDNVDFHEETDSPIYADDRNFYKVEKCTRDGMKVDSLLYAGDNLSKAQEIFANAITHRRDFHLVVSGHEREPQARRGASCLGPRQHRWDGGLSRRQQTADSRQPFEAASLARL